MPTIDIKEEEILTAFEKGQLKSVATKTELAKFKAAARATVIKDRRVNIQLSEQPSSVKSRSSSAAKRGSA
jgi:predicted DNA binding CopG/RHH family protein